MRRSLLVTLTLATGLAASSPWLVPPLIDLVQRQRLFAALTSTDIALRETALNQLIRLAPSDPQIVSRAAIAYENAGADFTNRVQLLNALRLAGCLDHPSVLAAVGRHLADAKTTEALTLWQSLLEGNVAGQPAVVEALSARLQHASNDAAFLLTAAWFDETGHWDGARVAPGVRRRRIRLLFEHAEAAKRAEAIERLGRHPDLDADAGIAALLAAAVGDPDTTVRNAALAYASRRLLSAAKATPEADGAAAMIVKATGDRTPATAFRAWVLLALLAQENVATVTATTDPESLPPAVAMAAAWATGQESQSSPPTGTTFAEPAFPGIQAYAEATRCGANATAFLDAAFEQVTQRFASGSSTPQQDVLVAWRLMLSHRHLQQTCGEAAYPDPVRKLRQALPKDSHFDALRTVAAFCDPSPVLDASLNTLARHAAMEGAAGLALPLAPRDDDAPITKVWAIEATATPEADWLGAAFRSESPPLRQRACLAARRRLDGPTLDAVIHHLLVDYDDDARRSGALLAGLTGRRSQLLQARLAVETERPLQIYMQTGLWMQGRVAEAATADTFDLAQHGAAFVLAGDLPRTALTLALLHRAAADRDRTSREHFATILTDWFLLEGRGEIDLLDLFIRQRWWQVAATYAPRSAPPLWIWGDTVLIDFQLDVLKAWALLHAPAHDAGKE